VLKLAVNTRIAGVALTLLLGTASSVTSQEPLVSLPFAVQAVSGRANKLALAIQIPPGLAQIAVETNEGAEWKQALAMQPTPRQTQVLADFAKPAAERCLVRLRAVQRSNNSVLFSPELQYIAMPPLGSRPGEGAEGSFHFRGTIEGSDKIVIRRDGALWNHSAPWPIRGSASVNGKTWNEKTLTYISAAGLAQFVPETFSLENAQLEVIAGRDVVALEKTANAVAIFIDDTLPGSAEYEIAVRFPRKTTEPAARVRRSTVARLSISAQIDGSDCLILTTNQAVWEHKAQEWPTNVVLNGIHWSPKETKVLQNRQETRFLPENVDLSTVRVLHRKCRDLLAVCPEKNEIRIWFADDPDESDSYQVDLLFGQ
jgi:hypothetical protein